MLKLDGRRCVVIGGGGVALRRARALLESGAAVTIIAPGVEPELAALPVAKVLRPYQPGDLAGAFLVVIATDDPVTNEAAAREARALQALVNRADEPEAGDLTIPAHGRRGPITVAVHTSGISARAAAEIRDHCLQAIDPDWPRLLAAVAPFRTRIQEAVADPAQRRDRLLRLTDAQAMQALKSGGDAALKSHCATLLEPAGRPTGPRQGPDDLNPS